MTAAAAMTAVRTTTTAVSAVSQIVSRPCVLRLLLRSAVQLRSGRLTPWLGGGPGCDPSGGSGVGFEGHVGNGLHDRVA